MTSYLHRAWLDALRLQAQASLVEPVPDDQYPQQCRQYELWKHVGADVTDESHRRKSSTLLYKADRSPDHSSPNESMQVRRWSESVT